MQPLGSRKDFKRGFPSCAGLKCTAECDHGAAYCARMIEAMERHNKESRCNSL